MNVPGPIDTGVRIPAAQVGDSATHRRQPV